MNLIQFTGEMHSLAERFMSYYLWHHMNESKENWPLDNNEPEWFEQFVMWYELGAIDPITNKEEFFEKKKGNK